MRVLEMRTKSSYLFQQYIISRFLLAPANPNATFSWPRTLSLGYRRFSVYPQLLQFSYRNLLNMDCYGCSLLLLLQVGAICDALLPLSGLSASLLSMAGVRGSVTMRLLRVRWLLRPQRYLNSVSFSVYRMLGREVMAYLYNTHGAIYISKEMPQDQQQHGRGGVRLVLLLPPDHPAGLLRYRHHYLRDLQSHFPDVTLATLLVCPEPDPTFPALPSTSTPPQQCMAMFHCATLPPTPTHLLGLILQTGDQHNGFLGHVAGSLCIYEVIVALAKFFNVHISEQLSYMSNKDGQARPISQLKYQMVSSYAGQYLKVYNLGELLSNRGAKSQDLLEFLNEKQENRSVPEIMSIHSRPAHYQREEQEVEKLIDQMVNGMEGQSGEAGERLWYGLVEYKGEEQVRGFRDRARDRARAPAIGIRDSQGEEEEGGLEGIVRELQARVRG